MAGVTALRRIQLGKETTAGTAVAATALWRGLGVIEDQREVTFVEENVGYLSGVDRTHTPKLMAALEMEEVPATYEQLGYLFAAGIENVVTGASDGVGSDKIYEYNVVTTAQQSPRTYTIEGGDDQEAEEMEYSFVEEFTLKGEAGGPLLVSAKWLGRQVAVTTFTGGIALPTVEDILFSKGKLYRDAIGGTIGTTQLTQTWLAFEMKVKTGFVPVFTGDGALYFTFVKNVGPEITIDLTFEHDAVAAARKVDWRAETAALWRFNWEGSTVATPGTTYSKKTLRIDCASKVETVEPLDESDGNDVLKLTLRPRYNATAAKFCDIIVVNELASLT